MCRAEEQNASVFGHTGKREIVTMPEPVDAVPVSIADTPNERLVDVLREFPSKPARTRRHMQSPRRALSCI